MFIRFVMQGKKEFVVDEIQAKEILASPQQLIPVLGILSGEWTGETLNKAHIVCTERDREAERDFESKKWRLEQRHKYLQELKDVPEEKRAEFEAERKKTAQDYKTMIAYLSKKMAITKA